MQITCFSRFDKNHCRIRLKTASKQTMRNKIDAKKWRKKFLRTEIIDVIEARLRSTVASFVEWKVTMKIKKREFNAVKNSLMNVSTERTIFRQQNWNNVQKSWWRLGNVFSAFSQWFKWVWTFEQFSICIADRSYEKFRKHNFKLLFETKQKILFETQC